MSIRPWCRKSRCVYDTVPVHHGPSFGVSNNRMHSSSCPLGRNHIRPAGNTTGVLLRIEYAFVGARCTRNGWILPSADVTLVCADRNRKHGIATRARTACCLRMFVSPSSGPVGFVGPPGLTSHGCTVPGWGQELAFFLDGMVACLAA